MKNYKTMLILINLVALLVFFNFSLLEKEKTIAKGELVLLELAPTDPRSLMQGDYMTLRYAIASNLSADEYPKRGFCVVALDDNRVAKLVRTQPTKTPLSANEHLIAYTLANREFNIGAESFFFEEGQSETFGTARYGALRIDGGGNSVLVGLYDANRKEIRVD
jgi:uncharacterized membrane-anchored protein